MPVRVGIDVVDLAEVAESLNMFGERYLERVFTRDEIRACSRGSDTRALASRLATKEAVVKVLGLENEPFDWRSIEVVVERDGSTRAVLRGGAALSASQQGMELDVDSTSTTSFALALAIAHEPRSHDSEEVGAHGRANP